MKCHLTSQVNDLCKPEKNFGLFSRLKVEFVVDLWYGESAKSVIILQTLHRISPFKRIRYEFDLFNIRVDELNGGILHYIIKEIDGEFSFVSLDSGFPQLSLKSTLIMESIQTNKGT